MYIHRKHRSLSRTPWEVYYARSAPHQSIPPRNSNHLNLLELSSYPDNHAISFGKQKVVFRFVVKTVISFKQKRFCKLIFYFLRKILKWRWSRPFSSKKSLHIFSQTDPLNHIISTFYTL